MITVVVGAVTGSQNGVIGQVQLPVVPVTSGELTVGATITLAAILLGTLLAAVLGGKAGERYHRKVDHVGIDAEV